MIKHLSLIIVLGMLALPTDTLAEGQIKISQVGSIYTDAAGVALQHPAGVTYTERALLVVDSGGKRILSFLYQEDGTMTPDAIFPVPKMFPLMIQPMADGNFYVLDGKEREIFVLDSTGQVKNKFTPKGLPDRKTIVPRSIKTGQNNSLLVLDIYSERVLVFDVEGKFQRQLPFPEKYGAFSDMAMDKQGNLYLLDSVQAIVYLAVAGTDKFETLTHEMKGNMNFPISLTTDIQGRLYLVDKHGSGLAIINPDGTFTGRKLSMGWNDGQLYYPNQISLSDQGDIFIADTENHRVQHFKISE